MRASGWCLGLDFDGTLVSCAPKQLAALRAALTFYGVGAWDLAEHWRLKRHGSGTVAALNAQGMPAKCARAVAERWRFEVERYPWLSLDFPFAGVRALLRKLTGRGVHVVLLSARRHPALLRMQLDAMGFREYFAAVEVVPPPQAVEAKAAVLKTWAPDLFVGDTEVDASAAEMAGTAFLAVATGQRSADFLRSLQDVPVFANVMDAVCAWWEEH